MPSEVPMNFFFDLAAAASQATLEHFRAKLDVENKSNEAFDPVTLADKASERAMRQLIMERYPDHGILGEEEAPLNLESEHIWVLDPIDGTRAFICGLPIWGVLIGLKVAGKASMGMMCQPFTKEFYFAGPDGASYQGPDGSRPLQTRACSQLDSAVIMTTTPALFSPEERTVYDQIEAEAQLARYGTDCYGYCMVASGLTDAVIETGLAPYDVTALIPIIEQAGGRITTWSGGPAEAGGQIVAAGDADLHATLLEKLRPVAR